MVAGLLAFAGVCGAAVPGVAGAKASKPPAYSLANVGAYGGEPSITANSKGELYDTTPSGGTVLYKSTDRGVSWTQATTADPASGDDCVFTDQSDALYLCNLAGSQSTGAAAGRRVEIAQRRAVMDVWQQQRQPAWRPERLRVKL
jgi:hypothetical protein